MSWPASRMAQVHLKIVQVIDCFLESPIKPSIQLTVKGCSDHLILCSGRNISLEKTAQSTLQNARDALLVNEYDDGIFDEAAVQVYSTLLSV